MAKEIVQPRTWEPDPVIDVYKKDVDRALLREHLKLTPSQRFELFLELHAFCDELRQSMIKAMSELHD